MNWEKSNRMEGVLKISQRHERVDAFEHLSWSWQLLRQNPLTKDGEAPKDNSHIHCGLTLTTSPKARQIKPKGVMCIKTWDVNEKKVSV